MLCSIEVPRKKRRETCSDLLWDKKLQIVFPSSVAKILLPLNAGVSTGFWTTFFRIDISVKNCSFQVLLSLSPFFTSRRKVTSQALLQNSLSFQSNGCGKITQKSTPVDPPLPEPKNEENMPQSPRSQARRLRSAPTTPSRSLGEGAASKFDS